MLNYSVEKLKANAIDTTRGCCQVKHT